VGAAEPAGDDHDVELGGVLAHLAGDQLDIVGDHENALRGNAPRREFGGDPGRVRVLGVARQQFVADSEKRRLHDTMEDAGMVSSYGTRRWRAAETGGDRGDREPMPPCRCSFRSRGNSTNVDSGGHCCQ
jgi:hypothetical protein